MNGAIDLRGLMPSHLVVPSAVAELRAHGGQPPPAEAAHSFDILTSGRTYTFYTSTEREHG